MAVGGISDCDLTPTIQLRNCPFTNPKDTGNNIQSDGAALFNGPSPDICPGICCRMANPHFCTIKRHFCMVPAATPWWKVEITSTGFSIHDPTCICPIQHPTMVSKCEITHLHNETVGNRTYVGGIVVHDPTFIYPINDPTLVNTFPTTIDMPMFMQDCHHHTPESKPHRDNHVYPFFDFC